MYSEAPSPRPSFSLGLLTIHLSSQAVSTADAMSLPRTFTRREASHIFGRLPIGSLIDVLDSYVKGEYVLSRPFDLDEDTLALLRASARGVSLPQMRPRWTSDDPFGLTRTFTLEVKRKIDKPAEQLETLQEMARAISRVEGIGTAQLVPLRYTMRAPSDDPEYDLQWHHKAIGSESAWDITMGDRGVAIAVVDTGVALDHEDLSENVQEGLNVTPSPSTAHELPGHEVDDDFAGPGKLPNDVAGHGTHVAGIVAAGEGNGVGGVGVAPRCQIVPIKCMTRYRNSETGEPLIYGTHLEVTQALLGVTKFKQVRAVNLSLGGTRPTLEELAGLLAARERDCVVTVSAGNDGAYKLTYPAAYKVSRPAETEHMLVVGATTENDFIAHFSNFGDFVDLVAPGEYIYSTLPSQRYGYLSGTSMAAPIVAGVAGLLFSEYPGATARQVVETIRTTARDLGPNQNDLFFGDGVVNAGRALRRRRGGF